LSYFKKTKYNLLYPIKSSFQTHFPPGQLNYFFLVNTFSRSKTLIILFTSLPAKYHSFLLHFINGFPQVVYIDIKNTWEWKPSMVPEEGDINFPNGGSVSSGTIFS